jgi:hypothetical protein
MVTGRIGMSALATCALLMGCGASPQVKATADYREGALTRGRVLFVPLAVSEALGDRRTGIILSDETRALASDAACAHLSAVSAAPSVVCWGADRATREPAFGQLQSLFALDETVPMDTWQNVSRASGATHALLFRPEAVGSSREVTRVERASSPVVILGTGGGLTAATLLVSGLVAANNMQVETSNETELRYTVSASLVDLRTGKLLKVGVHSGSASRTVKHNLGFAEPPPAAPILEGVMTELGKEVLDD